MNERAAIIISGGIATGLLTVVLVNYWPPLTASRALASSGPCRWASASEREWASGAA